MLISRPSKFVEFACKQLRRCDACVLAARRAAEIFLIFFQNTHESLGFQLAKPSGTTFLLPFSIFRQKAYALTKFLKIFSTA